MVHPQPTRLILNFVQLILTSFSLSLQFLLLNFYILINFSHSLDLFPSRPPFKIELDFAMYKGHVTLSFFFIFAGEGRDGV